MLISEDFLKEFRDVIYHQTGLNKGDFRKALEISMLDYVIKYSESEPAKDYAKLTKSELLKNVPNYHV